MARRDELCRDRRIGCEVSGIERKAAGAEAAERAERNRVVGDAGRLGALHDDAVDQDVGAIGPRPSGGDDFLSGFAPSAPTALARSAAWPDQAG